MSKFEPDQSNNSMSSGKALRKDHYSVQSLAEHIFVRECFSAKGKLSPDDRIVCSCDVSYDAHSYASSLDDQAHKPERAALPDPSTPSD